MDNNNKKESDQGSWIFQDDQDSLYKGLLQGKGRRIRMQDGICSSLCTGELNLF